MATFDHEDEANEERVRITLEIDCGKETLDAVMASIQEFVEANGDIWDWDVKGVEELT
ncbi:hypothetical protein LCGC14_2938380 [marine sediment metagenome]|uniref:Uncharacterized protein n=1 Tax=marine sediment metagenome TaxID=412755 RepID=A0A0F8XJC9_9ZZZZ